MYTVYKHTCPNGKIYIGITSLDVKTRWGKNGSLYKNMLFGKAIQKYGWDNIKHEILYKGLSKSEAELKEIELISKYKSNCKDFGYNIESGGYVNRHAQQTRDKMSKTRKNKPLSEQHKKSLSESRKGIKFSDEHIENIRKSHIGYIMPESQKHKISESCKNKGVKKVMQFALNGEFLQTFDSIKEALYSVGGKSEGNISSCCRGKKKNAYGYVWKYAERGQ